MLHYFAAFFVAALVAALVAAVFGYGGITVGAAKTVEIPPGPRYGIPPVRPTPAVSRGETPPTALLEAALLPAPGVRPR